MRTRMLILYLYFNLYLYVELYVVIISVIHNDVEEGGEEPTTKTSSHRQDTDTLLTKF